MVEFNRRHFVGITASAIVAAQLPRQGNAAILSRSGLPWRSGVFDYLDPDGFASWRGRPLDLLNDFPKKATWAEIRAMGIRYDRLLSPGKGNRPEKILVSYPLFPLEQNPRNHGLDLWQRAASGEFDWHHDAAAAGLAPFQGRFIIRLGWEWNTKSFFPWSLTDVALAPYYKTYFRRIVDRLRVRLPGCEIDWNATKKGATNAGIQNFYPGRDYVDYIGHDRYDWWPVLRTQEDWDLDYNRTYLGGPRGIGAWLAYARSEGKKLSVAEWAVTLPEQNGGGDNPFFVRKMLTFFRDNAADIGFECYFNVTNQFRKRLQENPLSAQAYRSLLASA